MFEGKDIRLRAFSKDDLPRIRDLINDWEVRRNLFGGIPFPNRLEDEEKWYNSFNPIDSAHYSFAIERKEDDLLMGSCGIAERDLKNRVTTLGIFLGKEFTEKGYGTEALRILVDFCFNEVNSNKVKLCVYEFNKRAQRCYHKVGFQQEGTLRQEIFREGRYWDVYLMGILREEWEKDKK